MFPAFFWQPVNGVDLCRAVRTVTNVHLEQSKVRTTHHWFIWAVQQDDKRVPKRCAFF